MLLDEPTNHLDIPVKEALEDSLFDYDGTLLFVSHDRYFIKQMATAILELSTDGSATYYPLSYEEYLHRNDRIEKKESPIEGNKKKEKPRLINYGKEISRLEKKIEEKEILLEELRELRYEPEYYQDSRKMAKLDSEIDDVHNEIENMMRQWEEYSEIMEENR